MRERLRHLSIRWRLAVWYTTVLGVVLAVFGSFLYSNLSTHLYNSVDEELARHVQHVSGTLLALGEEFRSGIPGTPESELLTPFGSPDVVTILFDGTGKVVAGTSPSPPVAPQLDPALRANGDLLPYVATVDVGHTGLQRDTPPGDVTPSGRWRVWVEPLFPPEGDDVADTLFLQLAATLQPVETTLRRFGLWLGAAGFFALALAGFIGFAVAESALRPIAAMTDTARAIAAGRGFHRRLDHPGRDDELGRLAVTFNEMLASLDQAYETQKRFVADASHELRAPLTTIRGNMRLLEQGDRLVPKEYQEVLTDTRLETERMSRLIADLLALAQADAGATLHHEPVELDRIVWDMAPSYHRRETPVTLRLLQVEPAVVEGDPDRLRQLLVILVENAFQYTSAGEVRISLVRDQGWAHLTVTDTGMGIADEDLPHIFERFYRADKARSRTTGGTGLGLAIARWIISEHGGGISVTSELGRGSAFRVRIPLRGDG